MAAKTSWKPGNLVVPAPAALVSCKDKNGKANLITVAWCGNINSDPPMLSISIRPERHSHHMIMETGVFVVNLPGSDLGKAVDYCGVVSGRDVDKWEEAGLTPFTMEKTECPAVAETPINIGCRLTRTIELGSHDMFLGIVEEIEVSSKFIDGKGKFQLDKAGLLCYAHGDYYNLGKKGGHFGWSIRKKKRI